MPNVCEEKDPEGQYSPWMVMRRKRNDFKGATPGKKLEGTSIRSCNSPLPPGPKISGRTSTSESGPTFKQSMSCGDLHYSSKDLLKLDESGQGLKFKGPSASQTSNHNEFSHDGPMKFTTAGSPSRPGSSAKSSPEISISAHNHKPFSYLVKGKKVIARGFASLTKISATVAHLSDTSSHSFPLSQPSPLDVVHRSNAFEFSTSTKADLDHCIGKGEFIEFKDGNFEARSNTHPWNGSDQSPTIGGIEAKNHHHSNGGSTRV